VNRARGRDDAEEDTPSTNIRPAVKVEIPKDLLTVKIPCSTSDGKKVEIEVELLLQSNTFKNMWSDLGITKLEDMEGLEYPLTGTASNILELIVQWMKFHIGVPDPEIIEPPPTYERKWLPITEEEKKFFLDLNTETFCLVFNASNFMDVKTLYYLCAQTLAEKFMKMEPEQIRAEYELVDDLSEEEKHEIKRKQIWLLDGSKAET